MKLRRCRRYGICLDDESVACLSITQWASVEMHYYGHLRVGDEHSEQIRGPLSAKRARELNRADRSSGYVWRKGMFCGRYTRRDELIADAIAVVEKMPGVSVLVEGDVFSTISNCPVLWRRGRANN